MTDLDYLRSEAQRITAATGHRVTIDVTYRRGEYTFTVTSAGTTDTIAGFSYRYARVFLVGLEEGAVR